jgi:hypothetical protein
MATMMQGIKVAPPTGPWTEQHIDESPIVQGKRFIRALFFGCKFTRLRGTTLEHCSLQGSTIAPSKLEDLLGVTITLDCFSWKYVTLNSLAFDAMLFLLSITRGNDEKREILKRMISEENRGHLEESFEHLETLYK